MKIQIKDEKDVRSVLKRMSELIDEFSVYADYRNMLAVSVEKLETRYVKKQVSYEKYNQLAEKLLEGKTKDEALRAYDLYLNDILEQITYCNAQIFYHFYKDTSYLSPGEKAEIAAAEKKVSEEEQKKESDIKKAEAEAKKAAAEPAKKTKAEKILKPEEQEIENAILGAREEKEGISEALLKSGKPGEIEAKAETAAGKPVKKNIFASFFESIKNIFSKKKKGKIPAEISTVGVGAATAKGKPLPGVKPEKKTEWASQTKATKTLLSLKKPEEQVEEEEEASRINPYLLAHEAKKIKSILSKQKEIKVYKPSTFGAFANHVSRRISIYLLDNFPDFFRYLYDAIRSANMKILSNTYLNIMILLSMITFVISGMFFARLFILKSTPFLLLIVNTLVAAILTALAVFGLMYYYPFSVIKVRRKSINANLPFAISHMSAVIGAGVPPTAMFKLISETEEYEEMSKELRKIVELTDVFGYDLTTAIKVVAANTPSPSLKEFFDGMITTIESGSDLKQYFKQKSDETMLSYSLEREKYLETLSTYSDIYTGILIAAPLFFVVALSLVSILGGTVGGIDVNVLVVIGTYAILPIINILFLLFLESTQPEA